jgi:pyruvate dehydrogenase E2 component (dihydrolipoamide acetyltransferase)
MPFEVRLPDIGEGIAEAEIVRWKVAPGEAVHEDQPLVEVMTDKANVEIPSPRNGRVARLCAAEGQVVPVGSVLVEIEEEGAPRVAATPAASAPSPGPAGAPPTTPAVEAGAPGAVQATPAVRALARELGVDLGGVAATGPGGRVTADDVRRAAGGAGPAAATPSRATAADEERVPLRGLRRRIAEHMRRSLDTAAHFTFVAEADMGEVTALRAAHADRVRAAGAALTYLPYVLQAIVEPLRRFPYLNSRLDEERDEIVLLRRIHLGVAVATDAGLVVPVIHDADRLSLVALARELGRLSRAAHEGRLKLEEIQGGTFTVTSTGAHGGLLATPIIHYPQVAILGVHEIKKRPVVRGDQIVARHMTQLSLSLDHRVVDGAVGADFLYAVIERLENPAPWLRLEEA